ncbi:hypothetical protein [Absidia glauca]|uniref:Uncharacterized protein n=1 Tax=Absidia glauca TaxID=4829 RepID=A0A168MVA7_ABSGL|nr:hypothetical protein [Absidia glauca]
MVEGSSTVCRQHTRPIPSNQRLPSEGTSDYNRLRWPVHQYRPPSPFSPNQQDYRGNSGGSWAQGRCVFPPPNIDE